MSARRLVVAVGAGDDTLAHLRTALAREGGVELLDLPDAEAALAALKAGPAELVLVDRIAETAAVGLARAIAALPERRCAVLATIAQGAGFRLEALEGGYDAVLAAPADVVAVHGLVRLAARLARAERGGAPAPTPAPGPTGAFAALERVLELALPGAGARGRRAADRALKVARRFHVPDALLADLERAALLHELGRVVDRDGGEPWRWLRETQVVLEQARSLRAAAEIVAGACENWDGTGHPGHLRQGQIPLRSRILRAVLDLEAELTLAPADPRRALEEIARHAGTRYDPMVLVHCGATLAERDGARPPAVAHLPVAELRPGMVLADDLCTDSGLKLISGGTALAESTLEVIRRRHQIEPFAGGIAVRLPDPPDADGDPVTPNRAA